MCCNPAPYILHNPWHTTHYHTPPTARYFFIPFQSSISFSFILVFHFLFISFPFTFFLFHFRPFLSISINHGTRLCWSSRIEFQVQIEPCITSPFCGSDRNDGFPCAVQHPEDPREAVSNMDHVLEHRSCRENCGRDESYGKSTFKAFKADYICELL